MQTQAADLTLERLLVLDVMATETRASQLMAALAQSAHWRTASTLSPERCLNVELVVHFKCRIEVLPSQEAALKREPI